MKPSFLPFIIAGATGSIIATVAPLLLSSSRADTKLLPFQGRLTDAAGNAVVDGARVVEFKMYDAPTGGNVKWAGEVHKLSVNGGLVNTMLGSKAGLGSVDFATATFLQITVDANGDGAITAADPPLLPRQSVVSAVYANEAGNARDSVKLAGADWSSIMVDGAGAPSNVPGTGFVKGAKIQAEGVTGAQLAGSAVTAAKVADGSLTVDDLGSNSVGTDEIINGSIQPADLSAGLQTSLVLPGSVVPYAGATVPANSGWLLCDGHEEPIASYPALAAVLGTKYGVPTVNPAATHFKLPDYRGLFLRGVDDPDGAGGLAAAGRDPDVTGRTALATGGNAQGNVGSLQADAFQGHYHHVYVGGFEGGSRLIQGGTDADNKNAFDTNGVLTAHYAYTAATIHSDFVNGTPRIASETRPKNAYVNYLIKY